jgi:hypothetical protein
MDPSQYSSQNRHVGTLGCSLRGMVAAVGDAIGDAVGDAIVECFGKCLCRKNDDTGACNGKCDKDQMAEKGVVTTATDFHV